jgi:flagellar L-ring protein FlgH
MIHWTLHPQARPIPYTHFAISTETTRRRSRRSILTMLAVVPLLMALAAVLSAQAPAAAKPDTSRPVRRSWTSDRRDFSVGDIILVLIDEETVASAEKGNTATDNKSRTMDAGGDLPIEVGPVGKKPKVSISSSNNGQSRQQGEARRGNRFVGEMSVRVVGVTKEGNLQIRGSKTVDVDKNRQQVTLSGFVRPEDVSSRDDIASSHIADVQLLYSAQGSLGKPKTGMITRILGAFWP